MLTLRVVVLFNLKGTIVFYGYRVDLPGFGDDTILVGVRVVKRRISLLIGVDTVHIFWTVIVRIGKVHNDSLQVNFNETICKKMEVDR